MIDRAEALSLLEEFHPEPHMLQHALASEAVMQALARKFGQDERLWGLVGLLHDLDYPLTKETPEQHGLKAAELLQGKLPPAGITAISAHNSECTGVEAMTRLDFALRAAETVTGLVTAAALMRPTGMEGMEVKSLKKKIKDKAFAAAVNRDRIRECERIDLALDEFLAVAIEALTPLDPRKSNH